MDGSNYQFSDEEMARFHQYRDNQDNARFIALLMLAEGIEIGKVASVKGHVDGSPKSLIARVSITPVV